MDKILVTLMGTAGIGLTYWFFLMKSEKETTVSKNSVDITVNGGYSPNVIVIPKGKTTELNFIRHDPNTCLEEIVLWDFHIRKQLPLGQKVTVPITPEKKGEFGYSCGMNMFHGKIIVK